MDQRIKWTLAGGLCVVAAGMLLNAAIGGEDVQSLAASDSAKDRLRAATVMAETDGDPQLLGRLANDRELTVALQAVHAMARRGDETSRQSLLALLGEARDPAVRGEAAAALGQFAQTDPSRLEALLAQQDDSRTRAGAAKGLARLGRHQPEQTIPILVRGLRDADPHVRIWSITGIYNATGKQFPGYDASRPPDTQRKVIAFIESKLREMEMLN